MPTCTMPLTGRFGNILFIYCFLRAYCQKRNYTMCLPENVVEKVFSVPKAVRPLYRHGPDDLRADITLPEDTHQRQESLIYTRAQVREWLKIKPDALEMLAPIRKNRKPVLLDWRRGDDYLGAGLVSLGEECYRDAVRDFGYQQEDCEWEIDTEPTRLPAFQGDVWAAGLGTTWVSLPAFYRYVTAKVLFRANSSFSWWGATLSDAKVYAPIIKGVRGGIPNQYAKFTEGNWPVMADNHPNTDLHIKEQ